MRPHIIIRYIGLIFLFNSLFLFTSFLISFYNNDSGMFPLLYSTIIAFIFGIFPLIYVPAAKNITSKEGFLIVVLSWLLTCLLGVIPYVIWGGGFSFTNAWFESVSGFTTTGASILTNIEILPKGLLFWRSATHWIGGIGIIVFALVILPNIGHIRTVLVKNEFSPLAQHNFIQNTKQVFRVLIIVYLGLTLLETIALWIAGMGLFDAVCHSFATIATGGFSTKNLSIAHFNSPAIDIIIMFFMFLSGIHFGLLFYTVIGNRYNIFKSGVVKFYFFSIVAGILFVTLNLYLNNYYGFFKSLQYASFQIVTLATTTGFANADSSAWPSFSIMLLIFFTLQCACAGSTAGGIKIDRVLILLKAIKIQIKKFHHPNAVISLKIDNKTVNPEAVNNAILYIVLYIFIVFISALLLTAMGVDSLSAFSGSAATMGNVGPGFNMVYSLGNYNAIPDAGKWILSANMLLGRLEIYALLSLIMYHYRR
ncbi:MAG: cation transporter [Bacteroidetes bacterium GWC2_33_15]|nr:MAG: cation transporter [Bacteroidetes bacterium GWA2_33_15]OFX51441.1 MAG: cation transporter [Bacteroidetes bacterium GWC2_33_15]OFX69469.1 MAG: cation transporter [Bacteroidetes bacterium GWD2_33_33]HAN17725.1 cation transporter [Bacteroidales bacterium]